MHTMSIVVMVNLKAAEGMAPWDCFHEDKERFGQFFSRVLALTEDCADEMGLHERTRWCHFICHAFQSLEDEMVRSQVLKLTSLPMWFTLAPVQLQQQLKQQPQLARPWKFLQEQPNPPHPPPL